MAPARKQIRIDVISDTVCPWCYIGKRRLERALEQRADAIEAEVRYHPFQLDPTVPAEGADARTHFAAKFGSWERFLQIASHVAAVGAAEGIPFAFEKATRTPNTLESHRLAWLAAGTGRQLDVIERLFAAHFVEGRDVGSREVLVDIGAAAGLDAAEVRAALAGDAGVAEVRGALEEARRLGISGVPFFIVQGKYALSGAQPVEVFLQLLDRAAAEA